MGGGEDKKVTGHIGQDCVDLLLRTLTFPPSEVKVMKSTKHRRAMSFGL